MLRTKLCSSKDPSLLFTCRERNSGAYGTPAYYIATLLFDMVPMRVIPPVFFAIFTYWLVGLHTQCIFCIFKFIGEPLRMATGAACIALLTAQAMDVGHPMFYR